MSQTPDAQPYDSVPYRGTAYPATHPNRLAAVATLMGMSPALPETCRVLELGCASGENLIPMAEQFPRGEFIGIDNSVVQIQAGQSIISHVGLQNVRLQHHDIRQVGPDFGKFDYIIAHGIYSWVPPEVREKVLEICAENLAPQGVALVSYNALPGSYLRRILRDAMNYHAEDEDTPDLRLRESFAIVDFIVRSLPKDHPYGDWIRHAQKNLQTTHQSNVLHDDLEANNEPFYLHEFVERSSKQGLKYVGDAHLGSISLSRFPSEVVRAVREMTSDRVRTEQYIDFVVNRSFRQSLLCHANVILEPEASWRRVLSLRVACQATLPQPVGIETTEAAAFNLPGGMVLTTQAPLAKAALIHLGEIWPDSIAMNDLLELVRRRAGAHAPAPNADPELDLRSLLQALLQGCELGKVEFSASPVPWVARVSQHPTASRLARHQAEIGDWITNRRHGTGRITPAMQKLLPLLDGKHDRASLLEAQPEALDATLEQIAGLALLIA
jgi:SAM-dependent methyltransferase